MSELKLVKLSQPSLILKQLITNTATAELQENSKENTTLADYYEKCITQAMTENIWPKSEISRRLAKKIDNELFLLASVYDPELKPEDIQINKRHWRRVASRLGCTNTDMSPHDLVPSLTKNDINFESHKILSNIQILCSEIKNKIKTKDNILFEVLNEKTRKNFYNEYETLINNLDDAFDDKQKVPKNLEYLFVSILCDATMALNEGATEFMEGRIKLLKAQGKKIITLKQTNKFLKNQKVSNLELFHPHDIQNAMFDGFIGVQCECTSWKVLVSELSRHKLQCQDCEKIFPAVNIPRCSTCHLLFYKENIKKIIENNSQCPQCSTAIILFEELKIWALHS